MTSVTFETEDHQALTLIPEPIVSVIAFETLDRRGNLDHRVRTVDLGPEPWPAWMSLLHRGRSPAPPRSRRVHPSPPVESIRRGRCRRARDIMGGDLEDGLRLLSYSAAASLATWASGIPGQSQKIVGLVVTRRYWQAGKSASAGSS
jgi:hypothetical protein